MLSYEHIYHAGNHADILKHTVFTLIVGHLKKKETPFTVIDTHAGEGFYRLDDERAQKTGELETGLKRFIAAYDDTSVHTTKKAQHVLEPFAELCKIYAVHGLYAGSPELARCLLRKGDELVLCELHPQAVKALTENMQQEPHFGAKTVRTHIHHRSGFEFLSSLHPPKRGLVLVDPSFEELSDFTNCAETLTLVHQRWRGGILALWYPLTTAKGLACSRMRQSLISCAQQLSQEPNVLDLQLTVRAPASLQGNAALYGSGLLVINSPHLLDKQLEAALPFLARALGGEDGKFSIRAY